MAILVMLLLLLALMALTLASDVARQPVRLLVCACMFLMACSFIAWRVAALSPQDGPWVWVSTIVDVVGLTDLMVFVVMMSRTVDRRRQADSGERRHRAMPTSEMPDVDVWIATYDEDWNILEKTLVGAMALDWPKGKLHVTVLDDGRRPWLRARCAALAVGYLTRPDNKHRKAGNHNNALANTRSPFILSLDADFIPFPNAIYRMIGLMDEPTTAIVQSPQVFYNPGPMNNNLLMQNALPDDLSFFYTVMQPARDAWNAAFYCGTSALLRRDALEAVGGFATESDIEDQITSLRLWSQGWATRFLNETLSIGLAPENAAAMHDQRNRWCRGSLQILFTRYGPFGPGFSMMQRLFFAQTYWVLGAVLPLFYAALPILIWGFGCRVIGEADAAEILWMPIMLMAGIWLFFLWLGRGTWVPLVTQAIQLYLAVEMLPTALTSLVKPFGRSLIHIRPVTAKGALAGQQVFDWPTTGIVFTLTALALGSLALAGFAPDVGMRSPNEQMAALAWTVYDLLILGIALLVCMQLPYRRLEERAIIRLPTVLNIPGMGSIPVLLSDLSLSGAGLLLGNDIAMDIDQAVALVTPGAGTCEGHVTRIMRGPSGQRRVGVVFTELTDAARAALIRRIFLGPGRIVPDPVISLRRIVAGLLARVGRTNY